MASQCQLCFFFSYLSLMIRALKTKGDNVHASVKGDEKGEGNVVGKIYLLQRVAKQLRAAFDQTCARFEFYERIIPFSTSYVGTAQGYSANTSNAGKTLIRGYIYIRSCKMSEMYVVCILCIYIVSTSGILYVLVAARACRFILPRPLQNKCLHCQRFLCAFHKKLGRDIIFYLSAVLSLSSLLLPPSFFSYCLSLFRSSPLLFGNARALATSRFIGEAIRAEECALKRKSQSRPATVR